MRSKLIQGKWKQRLGFVLWVVCFLYALNQVCQKLESQPHDLKKMEEVMAPIPFDSLQCSEIALVTNSLNEFDSLRLRYQAQYGLAPVVIVKDWSKGLPRYTVYVEDFRIKRTWMPSRGVVKAVANDYFKVVIFENE